MRTSYQAIASVGGIEGVGRISFEASFDAEYDVGKTYKTLLAIVG